MAEPTPAQGTDQAQLDTPEGVSDEQVQQMQDEVNRLRQEAADAEANRRRSLLAQENTVQYARLQAEAERLRLEISRTNAMSDQATADAQTSAPLAAAQASMQAAVAAQQAQQDLQQADQQAAQDAANQDEQAVPAAVTSADTGGAASATSATAVPSPGAADDTTSTKE